MAVFFEEARRRAAVIADAAACGAVSWDSESRAGEMLQPAGYRPAGAWVRAGGGWSAGRGRFCWNVLRSVRARFEVLARRLVFDLCPACVSIGMSCVRSRLLFAAWRQTGRLAGGCVSIPPWVEIAGSAFSMAVRLSGFVGSLRACAFLYGDPDGERKGRGNAENGGNGERSRRRGRVRFCVTALAL